MNGDHVIEDKDADNEREVGKRNYLQTEAMWGGSSIWGCPDYATNLSAFNLCYNCMCFALSLCILSPVIPGA